jgi:hypothetical protein
MASFKDIEQANSTIKTMQISRWDKKTGKNIVKDYAEVNQRIKAFRMLYPEGFIRTEIVSHSGDIVIIKAEAGYFDETGAERILGTGTAFEDKSNGMINGTSYIENCETSAVGRALGMIGLGIDMSIASFEEVNNAIAQQEAKVATSKSEAPAAKPTKKDPEPEEAPAPKDECSRCHQKVKDAEGQPANKIISETLRQFNRVYCMNCAHEVSAQMKSAGLINS